MKQTISEEGGKANQIKSNWAERKERAEKRGELICAKEGSGSKAEKGGGKAGKKGKGGKEEEEERGGRGRRETKEVSGHRGWGRAKEANEGKKDGRKKVMKKKVEISTKERFLVAGGRAN